MRTSPIVLVASAAIARAKLVDVEWVNDKSTGHTMLNVFSQDGQMIASSCSDTLKADHPISFTDSDENGIGNFTVGTTNYPIRYLPDSDEGVPSCSRANNDYLAVVDCDGLEWDSKNAKPLSGDHLVKDCLGFDDHFLRKNRHLPPPAIRRAPTTNLKSRQQDVGGSQWDWGANQCSSTADLVGNGDPHQVYVFKQLTDNTKCSGVPGCSTGNSDSSTHAETWSFSASLVAPAVFVTAGFSVTDSTTQGTSQTCPGNEADTVCLWSNVANTDYTVIQHTCDESGNIIDTQGIIRAPNVNNQGGGFFCANGARCQYKDAVFVDPAIYPGTAQDHPQGPPAWT